MAAAPDKKQVEEVNTQIKDFKGRAEKMLQDASVLFNSGLENAVKGYTMLQSTYQQGYEDVYKQAKKANEDMLKNLEENVKGLKQTLQQQYDTMKNTLNEGYAKSVAQFKGNCEEMMKKFPELKPASMNDTLANLSVHQKRTLEANDKQFKGILEMVDNRWKALANELTIPNMTAPKLVTPTMPKEKAAAPKKEGAAAPKKNKKN